MKSIWCPDVQWKTRKFEYVNSKGQGVNDPADFRVASRMLAKSLGFGTSGYRLGMVAA